MFFEFTVTAAGYSNLKCLQPPHYSHSLSTKLVLILARHENVNIQQESEAVIRTESPLLPPSLARHSSCFFAVLNVTELMLYEIVYSNSD